MFFSPASCLTPSSFSPSAHLAALLIPSFPSSALHTARLLAWGVLGRRDTNNYWATTRERNSCFCIRVCVSMYSCTIAEKCTWDECQCECGVVNNRGADGNTWSQLFPLPLCLSPVSCSPLMQNHWALCKHPCASSLFLLRFPFYLILSASDTCMLTPLTSWYIPAE